MGCPRLTYQPIGETDPLQKFTGHEFDDEAGLDLHHMVARLYDGDVGRFLSVDPKAGEYPGVSPYVYVLNNPLRLVDPDGKRATENIWWPQTLEEVDDIEELPLVIGDEIVVTAEAPTLQEQLEYLETLAMLNTIVGLSSGGAQLLTGPPQQIPFRHQVGRPGYLGSFISGSARHVPLQIGQIAGGVGRLSFASSVGIATMDTWRDPTSSQAALSITDVTFSYIGTFGIRALGITSPWGWAISGAYFLGRYTIQHGQIPEDFDPDPHAITPGLQPGPPRR